MPVSIIVSDGISMGTKGMKYSLVSREVSVDFMRGLCRTATEPQLPQFNLSCSHVPTTLTDQWMWFERHSEKDKGLIQKGVLPLDQKFVANPLPLDFVLLVNSAAPAIYSKTMRDFLTAHNHALQRAGSPYADTPIFISVTSSADKATGGLHPLANVFSPFYPSLQHDYANLLKMPKGQERSVHQSAFYNRTAGHQPLLVDHWIVNDGKVKEGAVRRQDVIDANLNYAVDNPLEFVAAPANSPDQINRWKFSVRPPPLGDAVGKPVRPARTQSLVLLVRPL